MPEIDKSSMTPGQKAAHTRKWREAQKKSHVTTRNAKTFTKYRLTEQGYRCVCFDTPRGYEYKGVVDLVAVKRDNQNPDNIRRKGQGHRRRGRTPKESGEEYQGRMEHSREAGEDRPVQERDTSVD